MNPDLFTPQIPGPSARFSECRRYRFELWRHWQPAGAPFALFIGLNPSTADETEDDPTIRRCVDFARQFGMGALCMANLFAFRATDPKDMRLAMDPVGDWNDATLLDLAGRAGLIVCAWGAHGDHLKRSARVRELLAGHHLHCLGKTASGQPRHPLYLAKTTPLIPL